MLEIQARPKVKASTVIQAMHAVERASRWRMLDLFTAEISHFYQSATILEVGPIPRGDMGAFLVEQFARGGRKLEPDILQAIFALAGDSPSDQQQFSYHLWTQSTPGHMGLPELRRAFATLMAEVSRRGEIILDEATPAQRRALLAIAVREDEEFARDSFLRFAGFRQHSSLSSAMRAFLKGNNAILEKRGSKVRYRERFMRLWMLLQVIRNPSMFPAARDLPPAAEYSLLLPYFADALS